MPDAPSASLKPLPVDSFTTAICDALATHHVLVLVAEPGAGKTTRVPPAMMADPRLLAKNQHIVMLQPRRTAARSTAEWIATEQGWKLGEEVGYQVRFESRISPRSRLHVVTEGILTRRLLGDPALEGCGIVILDEFHERSLDADLALMLLRESRDALRPDLKMVIMSATIDAGRIAEHLGGCPVIHVPGRTFPVEVTYDVASAHLPVTARIARSVEDATKNPDSGDILVFLPGLREIRDVQASLQPLIDSQIVKNTEIRTLHGSQTLAEQIATLRPGNKRRIILSTNIAETSLTIEGISTVVDSGLVRQAGFEDATGLDSLKTRRISEASARQRAGRAGRLGPGSARRVWSQQEPLAAFDLPEIERLDLSGFLLSCLSWGWTNPEQIDWLSEPPPERIRSSLKLLENLGAVEKNSLVLTPIGKLLAEMPVHPRLGRILLEGVAIGEPAEAALLVAMISERDFLDDFAAKRLSQRAGNRSDLLLRLDLLSQDANSGTESGIDRDAVYRVRQVAKQLGTLLHRVKIPNSLRNQDLYDSPLMDNDEARLARMILAGFSDRLCRRSQRASKTAFMARGLGIRLAPTSLETENEFFLAIDPRREDASHRGSEPVVRVALGIQKEWLDAWLEPLIETRRELQFDESSGKAKWLTEKKLHELTLSRTESQANAGELETAFREWAADHAEALLQSVPEVAAWLSRYHRLRDLSPELGWPHDPDWSSAAQGWASGCKTRDQLLRKPALSWVQSTLPTDAPRRVEAELPTSLTLPNGRTARIEYDAGHEYPIVQARVQDFFGWHESPKLVGGRLPILLELLAPNQRPVQRTLDLKSFWTNTYPQVRKDLRGRYPKHHWPDDPWTATAGPSIRRRQEN